MDFRENSLHDGRPSPAQRLRSRHRALASDAEQDGKAATSIACLRNATGVPEPLDLSPVGHRSTARPGTAEILQRAKSRAIHASSDAGSICQSENCESCTHWSVSCSSLSPSAASRQSSARSAFQCGTPSKTARLLGASLSETRPLFGLESHVHRDESSFGDFIIDAYRRRSARSTRSSRKRLPAFPATREALGYYKVLQDSVRKAIGGTRLVPMPSRHRFRNRDIILSTTSWPQAADLPFSEATSSSTTRSLRRERSLDVDSPQMSMLHCFKQGTVRESTRLILCPESYVTVVDDGSASTTGHDNKWTLKVAGLESISILSSSSALENGSDVEQFKFRQTFWLIQLRTRSERNLWQQTIKSLIRNLVKTEQEFRIGAVASSGEESGTGSTPQRLSHWSPRYQATSAAVSNEEFGDVKLLSPGLQPYEIASLPSVDDPSKHLDTALPAARHVSSTTPTHNVYTSILDLESVPNSPNPSYCTTKEVRSTFNLREDKEGKQEWLQNGKIALKNSMFGHDDPLEQTFKPIVSTRDLQKAQGLQARCGSSSQRYLTSGSSSVMDDAIDSCLSSPTRAQYPNNLELQKDPVASILTPDSLDSRHKSNLEWGRRRCSSSATQNFFSPPSDAFPAPPISFTLSASAAQGCVPSFQCSSVAISEKNDSLKCWPSANPSTQVWPGLDAHSEQLCSPAPSINLKNTFDGAVSVQSRTSLCSIGSSSLWRTDSASSCSRASTEMSLFEVPQINPTAAFNHCSTSSSWEMFQQLALGSPFTGPKSDSDEEQLYEAACRPKFAARLVPADTEMRMANDAQVQRLSQQSRNGTVPKAFGSAFNDTKVVQHPYRFRNSLAAATVQTQPGVRDPLTSLRRPQNGCFGVSCGSTRLEETPIDSSQNCLVWPRHITALNELDFSSDTIDANTHLNSPVLNGRSPAHSLSSIATSKQDIAAIWSPSLSTSDSGKSSADGESENPGWQERCVDKCGKLCVFKSQSEDPITQALAAQFPRPPMRRESLLCHERRLRDVGPRTGRVGVLESDRPLYETDGRLVQSETNILG